MSTRSLTHIKDGSGTTIATIYRHCDGYPSGHGKEMAEFLDGAIVVNGITYDNARKFNGAGCMAAYLVAHLKCEPGNIYLYAPDSSGVGEEYTYTVTAAPDQPIEIKCQGFDGDTLYAGPPDRFQAWVDRTESDEDE